MTITIRRRTVQGLLAAPAGLTALVGMGGRAWAAESEAPAGEGPVDLQPGGAVDRLLAERAAQDMFSGTVLLTQREGPALIRSFGLANKERSIPNGPDTIFRLASVTKCLTAVAMAQLAQRGAVAFHETVGTYLEGFPAEIAQHVTVHQLLTHSSGVGRPALGPRMAGTTQWGSAEEAWEGTLALIRRLPLQFAPGSAYGYSNDGYWVLGAVVAAVSGQSYYDYVREHVFAPAGMTHSDFYTKPQVLADERIARSYWRQPSGERVDAVTTAFSDFIGGPDGGAYATARDMVRFARALRDGTLLSPLYADLVTGGKVALSPRERPELPSEVRLYGYGFIDTIVNGHGLITHSGSGPGMATNLDIFRDSGWVGVILSNYDTTIEPIVGRAREAITQPGNASQPTPARAVPVAQRTRMEARLRAVFEGAAAEGRLSGAVLVSHIASEEPVFEGAYGWADREAGVRNEPATLFNIASTGKMFCGTAITQLAKAKKLHFSDPLSRWVPEFPRAQGDRITLHHLLTHTSGLGNVFGADNVAPLAGVQRLEEYLSRVVDATLRFEPGTGSGYTNAAFILLGIVLERAAGQSYHEYVRANIFEPADMGSTAIEPAGRSVAVPYTRFPMDGASSPMILRGPIQGGPAQAAGEPRRIDREPHHLGGPAGGQSSTVGDLARFARALRSYRLLDVEHTTLAVAPKPSMSGVAHTGGYGSTFSAALGTPVVGHGGGAPGVGGGIEIFWDLGYIVTVLSNYDSAGQAMSQQIGHILLS